MLYDIVIIGGGPSGMTAAIYALRNNKKVLILEKENFGGQIATSPRVENYPTIKEISGLELSDRMFEQITELGCDFELEEVLKLEKVDGLFEITTNYSKYTSKKVIIATGLSHRKMNLPHEEELSGKGISYCAVCDGAFYKGRETYLIGDANTALQYALLLSNYSPKVHMFTLFDRFFGEDVLIQKVLNTPNIEITHNMNLVEYEGEKELEGLVFENMLDQTRHEFKTNNVFIAIGQIPHNDIFAELVDLEKGFIITNENMETKTKGLFAVGDCRKKNIKQVITACNDGAIAALEACRS